MSAQANARNLAIQAFRAMYEKAVQSGSKLRGRFMEVTGVEAQTYHWPLIGVITETTRRQSGQFVQATETPNTRPLCNLTPDESWDFLDKQDLALTNVDLMRAYGETHGKAVARKGWDDKILAALAETPTSAAQLDNGPYRHPGMDVAPYNAAPFKLRLTKALLNSTAAGGFGISGSSHLRGPVLAAAQQMMMEFDDDLDPMDLTLVTPATQWTKLAASENFTQADYYQGLTNSGFMKTGRFSTLLGAEPIIMATKGARNVEGRAKRVNNHDVSYLAHRNAIGMAVGTTEQMGVVTFIEDRRSWLVGGECNTGACKIQEALVVEIEHED